MFFIFMAISLSLKTQRKGDGGLEGIWGAEQGSDYDDERKKHG